MRNHDVHQEDTIYTTGRTAKAWQL